jgi:hypothetical protein
VPGTGQRSWHNTRRRWQQIALLILVLPCGFWPTRSLASDLPVPGLSAPVEIHGFVSQGFIWSSPNEYLAASKGGSFEFNETALNFTNQVSDSLRVGFQLLARDLGPMGNYRPQFDWFYLDYQFRDWLSLRAGRIKMPFGLFNEVQDIDVARVPVLLPQSIYQADHREYIFAQSGAEVYGRISMGEPGAVEYRVYGGGLVPDLPGPPPVGVNVSNTRFPYVYGGRLLWSTPLDGLSAALSGQVLRLDADVSIDPAVLALFQAIGLAPMGAPNAFELEFVVTRWIASLHYTAFDWDLSAEYSRWIGEFSSPLPALFPARTENERYYVMASRRVNSLFTPGIYYSAYYVDVSDRSGHEKYQHDFAFTTRYDLNAHWLLKLEWHLMRGTAALDNRALNDGVEARHLAPFLGRIFCQNDRVLLTDRSQSLSPHFLFRHMARTELQSNARWRLLGIVLLVCSLCVLFVGRHAAWGQEVKPTFQIVANVDVGSSNVERQVLADIFLKQRTTWPDGSAAHAVDQLPEAYVRSPFSNQVIRRSVQAVRSYWQQRIFSGRGVPPPELDSDDAVLAYVRNRRGAVGYVSANAETKGVKVINLR